MEWPQLYSAIRDGKLGAYLESLPLSQDHWYDIVEPRARVTLFQMACAGTKNMDVLKKFLTYGEKLFMDTPAFDEHNQLVLKYLLISGKVTSEMVSSLFRHARNHVEMFTLCTLNGCIVWITIGWVQMLRKQFVYHRNRIITLLALKQRRTHSMKHLDRFLVRDLALAMWASRGMIVEKPYVERKHR